MKKKRNVKSKKNNTKTEIKKLEKEFVSFGNKKNVFWSITFFAIILTLISVPTIFQDETMLKRFIVIWILELIYMGLYVSGKKKK
jgi:hypothetical protein